MRTRLLTLLIALGGLLAAVVIGALIAPPPEPPDEQPRTQTIAMVQPTGVAYDTERRCLFVLDADGTIGQFDLAGHCRQVFRPTASIEDLDLEGVTVDPLTGWLYVVDRAGYRILEIDIGREPAIVRRVFALPIDEVPVLRAERIARRGLAGICFLPPEGRQRGGRFMLVHQAQPAGLIEVELPLADNDAILTTRPAVAQFVNWYSLGTDGLSGAAYDRATRTLLVVNDNRQELLWVSLDGDLLRSEKLGSAMTGVDVLPDRRLVTTAPNVGLEWRRPRQWGDTLPSSAQATDETGDVEARAKPPAPFYTTIEFSMKDDLFPYYHTRSDWQRYRPNGWILFGFGGQFLFMMRFIVQWFASERRKRVVVPVAFWYISIAGSLTILVYALHRRDIVFIAGQALACTIYVRNLMLVYYRRKLGDADGASAFPSPPVSSS